MEISASKVCGRFFLISAVHKAKLMAGNAYVRLVKGGDIQRVATG